MQIRELVAKDLADCATLFVAVFAAEPWNERWEVADVETRLREVFDTPGFFGLAAFDDAGPVGFVVGYAETWGRTRHFYVKEMCVRGDRQRGGVGTALMDALGERLKERGASKVYLLTAREGPAQAFYEKCGFYTSGKMVMMGKYLS